MGYKATKHTVYIVQWPDQRVVKAGYSLHQRWRAFELRGAVVVDLIEFESHNDAYVFEQLVDAALCAACRKRPFKSAKDAAPLLGTGGGGWMECWALPPGLTPMQILTETDWEAA